jgi:nitroimidazol reductase NimA-like FMN-containing flavoprotein (pyridoxamine 5'-phosphate oxidase superfamily)
MKTRLPKFREMRDAEMRALLRRHHVGRIAFTFKDKVDIVPISYAFNGRWLYARTAFGTKLIQMKRNPWVAFQVDEVDGPFDWRSVVAHGTAYFLNTGAMPHPEYGRAVKMLRKIDDRILTDEDLVPERTILFRIHVDALSGRAAELEGIRRRGISKRTR